MVEFSTLTESIFANQKLKQNLIDTSKRTGAKIFEGTISVSKPIGVAHKNYDFRQNKLSLETIKTIVLPEGHKLRKKGILEIFTQVNERGDRTIGLIDATPEVVSHGNKKISPESYKQLVHDIRSMSENKLDFIVGD